MTSRRRARRGYTLVAMTIGLTVMMVMIAAVLPLASTQVQREKEEELIFRGRQYAEGIRCFRRKYGRYPNSLKEMLDVRPRTIRKLWKDPITNSKDWGLITLGSPDGGGVPGFPSGTPRAGGSTDGGGFFGGKATPTPSPSPTPAPTPDPFDGGSGSGGDKGSKGGSADKGGFGSGEPGQGLLPIAGVYSKSKKKAFRSWQGRDVYDQWKFNEQSLTSNGANTFPPGMGPGGRGPGISWP